MIELGKQKNGFQYEELLKNNNCNDINELLNEKQSMQLLEPKF